MKKKKKTKRKRLPKFKLDESIRKLFPPVSEMGITTPTPYDNYLRPSKTRSRPEEQIYSTAV